jgi:exonuclease V gamma subunit
MKNILYIVNFPELFPRKVTTINQYTNLNQYFTVFLYIIIDGKKYWKKKQHAW